MNVLLPPTDKPDPTTPGPKPAPTALGGAFTTALVGTPPALATVWLLETYGTAHGKPIQLDSLTATALGSIGASFIGYVWHVLTALGQALIDKWTTPK